MLEDYIELDRSFSEIPKNQEFDEDRYDIQLAFGWTTPLKWDDLLKQKRVIILAEAGVGKTTEIMSVTRKLRNEGKIAFFLRLEHLGNSFENSFDIGTYQEFEVWLTSNQPGWIFLDSVDEARLTGPKQFEAAIRIFSGKLGQARQGAHVYITSRLTEWRPVSDFQLVKEKLALIEETTQEIKESFSDGVAGKQTSGFLKNSNSKPQFSDPKIYGLNPLDKTQIRQFSTGKRVEDVDNFVDSIYREEAEIFATRPQDLEELINFWKSEKRIGRRLELLENSIRLKLIEIDPERSNALPLTECDAEYGIETVAAAVILQQQSRIRIPDAHNNVAGIDVSKILPNWASDKIRALLNRPIFDEAIYGTVRFHHRIAREFLAAKWILRLLNSDKSRYEIEKLFFRKQYGRYVVIPTMRPVLPWLILFDDSFREKTTSIAPEVLIEGGDPASLATDIRKELLNQFCDHYKNKSTHWVSLDISAVQRFAHPDLGSTIIVLLKEYADQDDIIHLLLRMIWRSEIKCCAPVVLPIAMDKTTDIYSRKCAMRAIGVIGTRMEVNQLIEQTVDDESEVDDKIISEFIEVFWPRQISISQVIQLLRRFQKPELLKYSHLRSAVSRFVEQCSVDQLSEFVTRILHLLRQEPYVERRSFEVSENYIWLLPYSAKACEILVRARRRESFSDDVVSTISLAATAEQYQDDGYHEFKFTDIVSKWPELNSALFWYDVVQTRKSLNKKNGEKLVNWWQASAWGHYWRFSSNDFDDVLEEITSQALLDNRLVAISLAFTIYKENGRKRKWRENLKKSVAGKAELEKRLHTFLHPLPMSAEERKWRQSDAYYKRQRKEREKLEAQNKADWRKWLSENTHVLRDTTIAAKGSIWNACIYLRDIIRDKSEDSNNWAQGYWKALIPEFGTEVAEAFRDGAMEYWRLYTPDILSDNLDDPNSVPYAVVFGLCGLEIESQFVENWPSELSSEEAILACRYAVREMNGFTTWLPRLHVAFPEEVEMVLLHEIEWEISCYDGEKECHYVLSDVAWQGDWIKSKISDRLIDILADHSPKHDKTLQNALGIILGEQISDINLFAQLAQEAANSKETMDRRAIWFGAWMSVDSQNALVGLTNQLSSIADDEETVRFATVFLTSLISGRSKEYSKSVHCSYHEVTVLRDLYLLMRKYIHPNKDSRRDGFVTSRHDAQDVRDHLFALLKQIPGKESYLAILYIGHHLADIKEQGWIEAVAQKKAEEEADLIPMTAIDIRTFADEAEYAPINHQQLFSLVESRLLGFKAEMEDGDSSDADVWVNVSEETQHRKHIGKWLRDRAHGRYAVPQEDELADAKRPDIRIFGMGMDCPVPIELKIADGGWSGAKLFERLENQLCGDYLRDIRSSRGIYLLLYRGEQQHWVHPESKEELKFRELIASLQGHANDFIADKPGIDEIKVIGVDLTHRSNRRKK